MSADTPHLVGDCIDASLTVTLAAPKLPLVLPPGEAYAGDVVIADIGIPHEVIDSLEGPHVELLTPEQLRGLVAPRAADSHKGDFGRLTLVAGSTGKTGAAYLAAMARAALGRRARDRGHTRIVPARSLRRWDRTFMTLDLPEDARHGQRSQPSIGCWSRRTTSWRAGQAWADPRTSPNSCGDCSIARRVRSCSTPTRSPCWPTIPDG